MSAKKRRTPHWNPRVSHARECATSDQWRGLALWLVAHLGVTYDGALKDLLAAVQAEQAHRRRGGQWPAPRS